MKIQQSIFTTLALAGHHSDRELLFVAISNFRKEHHGQFQSAGSYERRMVSPDNYNSKDQAGQTVTIPRIRLKKDSPDVDPENPNATHAVTADILIPNSSYTIRFVLTVLYGSLHRSGALDELCQKYQITHSTYYHWKHLFEAHCASWLHSLLEATRLCDDLFSAIQSIPAFPWRFYLAFSVSFLQSRCRNCRILAPTAPG